MRRVLLAAALVMAGCGGATAQPADRHEGYYYPKVTSYESYVSRARVMDDSDRARRIAFVSGLTQQLADLPYAPSYAIFAKGAEADRLIIVAYGDGQINTIYRARAPHAAVPRFAGRGFVHFLRSRQAARLPHHHHQRRRQVRPSGRAQIASGERRLDSFLQRMYLANMLINKLIKCVTLIVGALVLPALAEAKVFEEEIAPRMEEGYRSGRLVAPQLLYAVLEGWTLAYVVVDIASPAKRSHGAQDDEP